MKRPDFTPEQLAKLNEIFGENKTQRITYAAGKGTESQPELSPAQRLLASPEAVRLRERGYDERETLDALTRQLMMPGKDIISSLPDKRYKAPEIDPTVLPGDTPTYTTLTGDVLTKDDADMDKWTAWRREPENAEALFRMETGKSSAQYEKELKEDLRREVTGILERANSRIRQTEKRVAEAVGGGPVGTLAKARIYGMPKMAKGGKDADLAVMAKRILGQLDSKTAKDRDEGDKSSGLWRGIKNNLTAEDFLSAGYSSILENLLEARTLDKAHRGEKLTETEQDVLRLKGLEQRVNDYLALRGGKTRGAKVGEGLAHSAPFMAQFGLTSGIGSMPSVGRAVAGKLLQSGVKKGVAKGVGAVARMGAEAGKMSPLQAAPYNNYLERTAEQYRIGDDGTVSKLATPAFVRAYKGLADAYVDVFTEKTGEGFGVLFRSLVGRPVAQLARTMGLAQYMNRIPRSAALDAFRKRVGFNGAVGEFLEEVEGNFLAPLLTGETERWKEGFSADNLWTTFLTTSVMSAGFASLELPGAADYARRSARLHVAEKKALAGIGNPELKTAVFAAMQQPTLATQSKALSGIDWKADGITGMDAAHAVDYARFRTERTILDGATRGLAQAEKIDNIHREIQQFQYRGEDGQVPSGEFVAAQGQDGNAYVVLSGGLSAETLDDNLFVWDEQAQQIRQISRTELQDVQRVPVNDYIVQQYRQQDETQEAEQQAGQAAEDIRTATEAGIPPQEAERIVMPEAEQAVSDETAELASETAGEPEQSPAPEVEQPGGIDGTQDAGAEPEPIAEQYTNEDRIVLADGRRGVVVAREVDGYIVELDGGTFEKVPYNRVAGRGGELEAASVPVAPAEPERPTAAAPAPEIGPGAVPPVQAAETSTKIPTAEPQVGMPMTAGKVPQSARTRRLKMRKKQVSPYAAKAAALGDFVSIEDVILRDIAGGLRFVWGNRDSKRGLADELGFTDSETERRVRIGILSNEGVTPENYAEHLYFEYGNGNESENGVRWNLDDGQIKDAVLEILSHITSPKQAYEEAVRLHESEENPYADYTPEELAEMERHEAVRQAEENRILGEPLFSFYAGETTPEQWAEIDNLFAENSTDFAENANFEPLAEQPEAAVDQFNTILFDENKAGRTDQPDRPSKTEVGEDYRHAGGGQRSDAAADNSPQQGEPEAGPWAVRHDGGGLESVRPVLTEAEQRVADEAAAGIEARQEELRAELSAKQSQYNAEKKKIDRSITELESLWARRSVEKSVGGVSFGKVEKITHTKTGKDLFAVKLTTRVDADMFGVLKQRAKANDGYYSKFSRAFLFDTPEDAEAFRAEYAPKQEVEGTTGQQNDYLSGTKADESGTAPQNHNSYEPNRPSNLQPDSGGISAENGIDAAVVRSESGRDRRDGGQSPGDAGAGSDRTLFGQPADGTAGSTGDVAGVGRVAGARSNQPIQEQAPGNLPGIAGTADGRGSGGVRGHGIGTDAAGKTTDGTTAPGGSRGEHRAGQIDLFLSDKRAAQLRAESIPVETGNPDNIAATLPYLLPEQHDDVLKAERRFYDESRYERDTADGKGMMFTNGTGTGKTYTGLGIIKRAVKRGAENVLIVVPSQTKVSDWVHDAENLNLKITPLTGIEDAGEGVNITTYANFGVNEALYTRSFDMVVYDECHRLMEEKDGEASGRTKQHYLISNKDARSYAQRRLRTEDEYRQREKLLQEVKKARNVLLQNEGQSDKGARPLDEIQKEIDALTAVLNAKEREYRAEGEREAGRTKVIFLSATPFKSHFSLRYAEGYLFRYPDVEKGGYNSAGPEEMFFLQHFGGAYQMRYNRLERHAEDAELVAKQEIAFSEYLKEKGVLSGRMISSDMDYSRDFPVVTGFNAGAFNKALEDVFDYEGPFNDLQEGFSKVFHDYNYSTKLFETLKAAAAEQRIREHLALGRKIVVFHRRIQGGMRPPFGLALHYARGIATKKDDSGERMAILKQIAGFREKYAGLLRYERTLDYRPVQVQLREKFGGRVRLFNGSVTTGEKNKAVKAFNNDTSGVDIIVIQEDSGKEGISLHDMTGAHQRVLMNLTLPNSSITALQIEGRIYRIGNRTDAIFEYPLLGLNSEVAHFGSNINKQLSTTENLAMGALARDLLNSFKNGVEAAGEVDVTMQGKGGKTADRSVEVSVANDFERAIMHYYATQKRTSANRSREGTDYYATPEPLGFKMVEWADGREGDNYLEPSAGHGAIARYVPVSGQLTAIEPSTELYSKLNLLAGGGTRKVLQGTFEEHSLVNKYDVILMNPPFGVGGKTAAEHIAKAYLHLRKGGRIVAIVPDGPAMQKRLDALLYGEKADKDMILRAEVRLPGVTFGRAGTQMWTKVIIIDRIGGTPYIPSPVQYDLREHKDVRSLFGALQTMEMPGRILPKETEPDGENNELRFREAVTEGREVESREAVEAAAVRLAGALHTPVEVVRDVEAITDADAGRQKRKRTARGWYDVETGKVVLVLPNAESAADAEATVLHEVVGHMGLRAVLGERFGDFLDRVYMDEDGSLQRPIDEKADEEQRKRTEAGQPPLTAVEARRLATEEYLAGLAEGNRTPGRFARIIGTVRRWLREALGVPLRVGDRDIAYMLWLSRHRLASSRTAADAVRRTAAARRVKAALYGSASERYRIVVDEADPRTMERYCVAEWLKDHRLPGVELGEHWDEMARIVYDNATDLGRSVIHNLFGEEPLRATKRYMALRNIREITDREGLNRIIDKLTKVLPREKRQQIVDSQRKHLEFVLSDDYKSPLRRRSSKDEKPLPENFKYAAEFVEELLAKRKKQETIAPAGEIEPTVLYDKKKPLHVIESILLDSTMPVRKLQEEIIRRGGRIDDITDVYAHLNHYSSVTKVALQKYTDDYINPLLDRVAALASLTGADMDAVTDYISAESSLERDLSGVPALSPDPESDWNREVTEAMIKAFRELAGRKRVEAVERDGIGGIPVEERAELPAGLLDKVKRDGLASLDAAELSELREAPVVSLWRAVNAANDRVLDLLVEDGMMAQETRKLVKGHNWKYYVPLRSYDYSVRDDKDDITRFDATEVYDFIATRRTPGRLRQVVQEAEGRFTKPFNPVVQMVNIGIGAVISAKTNRMRQSALRLAQNTKGGADLFRVNRVWLAKAVGNRWVTTTINPSVEDIELSKAARKEIARLNKELQQAKKAHDEQGIAILEGQIEEAERYNIVRECRATDDGGEVFGREANVSPSLQRQRCVECYVNGIKYIVTFADPAVANAINGYHRLSIPQWVDDTVGNATRWLARAFTSRNPAFVAVNFLRDVQHAALIHTLDREGDLRGFVRHIMPGMAAISRNVQGKARPLTVADLKGADILTVAGRQRLVWLYGPTRVYDTLYDYFRENGGETGFVHGKSVKEAERDVRRYVAFRTGTVGQLLRNAKRSERPEIALSYAARRTGAKAVAEAFDRASRIAENTSRFATFVASLDQGKTLLRAISDAKNVTVNFNRRGTASRALGMFYVFFNASVQGAAQVARVALRNRRRFAAAVATMITGGFLESLLLDFFLASQDDDRNYISQYDRRNHLLVPYIGRHGYGKIPLPQGFRAFHGIGLLLHDAYKGKITAEECARSMWNVLYEDFSPVASPTDRGDLARVVVPTAATPFYDIWYAKEDTFGYPVGKRTFDDAPNYPLSEMGLKNVNRAILAFCRGLNALGGGDRDTPAGLRQSGEIDPLLRGLFEWNPSHVEHVLTYYGGGMGKFVKDVVHTVQSLVEPDAELNSYDLPIINRLYGTTRKENPANRYYTMKERMTNLAARYRRMGDRAEAAGPEARRDLERVRLFREYDRIVNRIRKVMAGTNPGSAEYEKLQQELDATMREYLQTDERYVTGN